MTLPLRQLLDSGRRPGLGRRHLRGVAGGQPRLLLLDEVTSQLDAANERALKETIHEVSKRCAVVVIAHRLSTVVEADKIILLDGGKVSTQGNHEELLQISPLYGKLVQTQMIEAEGLPAGGSRRGV